MTLQAEGPVRPSEISPGKPAGRSRRIAGAFVLIVLFLACGMLLTVVPAGSIWVASKLSNDIAGHFLVALPLTAAAMAAWMALVLWLNNLYLRIDGTIARVEADARAGWHRARLSGPVEPMLVIWFFLALAAFAVWFLFVADESPRQVI